MDREALYPSQDKKALYSKWHAMPDDLIGGWCIMTDNIPPSQITKETDVMYVAGFTSGAVAKHIVALHNPWVEENITFQIAKEIGAI